MHTPSRFGSQSTIRIATLLIIGGITCATADAQRIRIPDGQIQTSPAIPATQTQFSTLPPIQTPGLTPTNPAVVSPPLMQLPPLNPPPGATGGFDAYGGIGTTVPTTPWPQGTPGTGAMIYPPANAYPWVGSDAGISASPAPGVFAPADGSPSIYGPTLGAPAAPLGAEANWNAQNGAWPNSPETWPNQAWSRVRNEFLPRLIEHPRLRYTYLYGDEGNDLEIHDAELAATLTFPGFWVMRQPWRVSPGFIFHFWDGPDTAVTGVDLPSKAYSAYLAADYLTAANRPLGAELNLTVGMYTDFNHVTTDSLRITGVGVGWVRLDNTTTFKLGIEYLDRLDIKLLPAVGVFMMPTSEVKMDLYFPRPKIARRIPNNYNFEVWSYVGGEYGGGSWTIEREGGMGDQVDINDVRVFIGAEWMGRRQVTGFMEIGYVFQRQLVYRSLVNPIDISDTFMFRSGLSF